MTVGSTSPPPSPENSQGTGEPRLKGTAAHEEGTLTRIVGASRL